MPAVLALLLLIPLLYFARNRKPAKTEPPLLPPKEFNRLMALINQKKQLEAMKEYRRLTGASLEQAQEWLSRLT